jgi:hypothetical protein
VSLTVAALALLIAPQGRPAAPYTKVNEPLTFTTIERELKGASEGVWRQGDTLIFAVRSRAASMMLSGGIQEPMQRVPGSDWWQVQLKMANWDEAFVSYLFWDPASPGTPQMRLWAGPRAPRLPIVSSSPLNLKMHSVASTYLG